LINLDFLDKYSKASKLLGMEITLANPETGELEANFNAQNIFNNTADNIQGGILTAMLDDLMGYALGITLPATQFAPTANLNVSFLRPAKVGVLHGKGQVLKQEGDVFHLAGKLYNDKNELVASATAKAKRMQL
jgi:uncharacterized protein (TIGR00369 family)